MSRELTSSREAFGVGQYQLLVVVHGEPKARKVGYALLEDLVLMASVQTAVQDGGHLALVATHAQQLHSEILTQLLQAQVLRLQGGRDSGKSGQRAQADRGTARKSAESHPTLNSGSFCESLRSSLLRLKACSMGSSEVMDR